MAADSCSPRLRSQLVAVAEMLYTKRTDVIPSVCCSCYGSFSVGVVERSIPARLVDKTELKPFYRKAPHRAEWDNPRGCFAPPFGVAQHDTRSTILDSAGYIFRRKGSVCWGPRLRSA